MSIETCFVPRWAHQRQVYVLHSFHRNLYTNFYGLFDHDDIYAFNRFMRWYCNRVVSGLAESPMAERDISFLNYKWYHGWYQIRFK